MRDARTATGVAAIPVLDFACGLLHHVNTDATLDCHHPMANAGRLRIRIRQFKVVLKRCTFADAVWTMTVLAWTILG